MPRTPFPKQQRFLMHTETPEALFGGAAGGGKSAAALLAAAQFIPVPGYAGLLLRASFPDLMQPKALIPLSKEFWYGRPGATWNAQERRWTFTLDGGGTSSLTFGYLERDDDVYQYQGAEYQYICIDELTQHTEFRYRYLFSRLRKVLASPVAAVPLRMRATANPGGKGHDWVKRHFVDPRTRAPGAVFVPSKAQDNLALDLPTYLHSLSHLDPTTRAQLLEGDWTAIEEGRFKRAWLRHYHHYGSGFQLGPPGARIVSPDKVTLRFLTLDSAATVKATSTKDPDYTCVSSWALAEGLLFWLGCVITRMEIPEIPALVAREYAKHKAGMVYCCSPGTELAVPQLLNQHSSPRMNVSNLDASGDKLQKASHALNMAEAGRVWFPAPGVRPEFPLEDVESQLLRFTGDPKQSRHDDAWDCLGVAGRVAKARDDAGARAVPYLIHI
jgi:phage terminase large subunit-like protein